MKNIKDMRVSNELKNLPRIFRFLLVGIFNTGVTLVAYYILIRLNIHFLFASSVAYVLGIFIGYILNSILVFNQKQSIKSMTKYVTVYGFVFALNLVIMYLCVVLIGINKLAAQLIAIIINTSVSYLINSVWTFRKSSKGSVESNQWDGDLHE